MAALVESPEGLEYFVEQLCSRTGCVRATAGQVAEDSYCDGDTDLCIRGDALLVGQCH